MVVCQRYECSEGLLGFFDANNDNVEFILYIHIYIDQWRAVPLVTGLSVGT